MDRPTQKTDLSDIVARIKDRQETDERLLSEKDRATRAEADAAAHSRQKEAEVLALVDEVVVEVNAHLPQPLIKISNRSRGKEYGFSNRTLNVHFFREGELYTSPLVPGRMETLRNRHTVHGGYIEIQEGGEDRQGWNLVLVRPSVSAAGEWRIVETRVSGLSRITARFEPFATEAQLFADNLACHWSSAMHSFNLSDKALERVDILKIVNTFVP